MFKLFQYPLFLLFNLQYKNGNHKPRVVPYIATAGTVTFFQWSILLIIILLIEKVLGVSFLKFIWPEPQKPLTALNSLMCLLIKYCICAFVINSLYFINKHYFITKGLLDRLYQTFKDHPSNTRVKRSFFHTCLLLYALLVFILLFSNYQCFQPLILSCVFWPNLAQLINRPSKKQIKALEKSLKLNSNNAEMTKLPSQECSKMHSIADTNTFSTNFTFREKKPNRGSIAKYLASLFITDTLIFIFICVLFLSVATFFEEESPFSFRLQTPFQSASFLFELALCTSALRLIFFYPFQILPLIWVAKKMEGRKRVLVTALVDSGLFVPIILSSAFVFQIDFLAKPIFYVLAIAAFLSPFVLNKIVPFNKLIPPAQV